MLTQARFLLLFLLLQSLVVGLLLLVRLIKLPESLLLQFRSLRSLALLLSLCRLDPFGLHLIVLRRLALLLLLNLLLLVALLFRRLVLAPRLALRLLGRLRGPSLGLLGLALLLHFDLLQPVCGHLIGLIGLALLLLRDVLAAGCLHAAGWCPHGRLA